jgi:addiction module HigA family antidote
MRPIDPGEILPEFPVPLGMTHALSLAIHVPATRVNDIVNGKQGVTADTALRLARYFGNSPEFWLNLLAQWRSVFGSDARAAVAQGIDDKGASDPICLLRTQGLWGSIPAGRTNKSTV